jgi:hypothetical protein
VVQILNSPDPELDNLDLHMVYTFSVECPQGIAYAYEDRWFLSAEKNLFKYSIMGDLFNPIVSPLKEVSLSDLLRATGINLKGYDFDHIGALTYFADLLFFPIRDHSSKQAHILLGLSPNLDLVGYSWLAQGTSDAWCALNPWAMRKLRRPGNHLLYMSPNERASYFIIYDVGEYYMLLSQPNQWGKEVPITLSDKKFFLYIKDGSADLVDSVQGASFSPNGRLYVAWYEGSGPWTNHIRVYSALTGLQLDDKIYDFSGWYDEIEGVSVHPSGYLYVAVSDWNSPPEDDTFDIYAFKYRDPSLPM